jgi:hypothetical protein
MIKHWKLLFIFAFLLGIGLSFQHITTNRDVHQFVIKPLEFSRPVLTVQNRNTSFPSKITPVYRKFRPKSLHVNFHFLSNDSYMLLPGRFSECLAWSYNINIRSFSKFFHGSRAPPVMC